MQAALHRFANPDVFPLHLIAEVHRLADAILKMLRLFVENSPSQPSPSELARLLP
jgi:type II secretory pathway predicted ATPase ExeA